MTALERHCLPKARPAQKIAVIKREDTLPPVGYVFTMFAAAERNGHKCVVRMTRTIDTEIGRDVLTAVEQLAYDIGEVLSADLLGIQRKQATGELSWSLTEGVPIQ